MYFIVPTAPINFTSNHTKTNITFRWRRPDSPNGVIIQYNLIVLNLNMPNTTISIIHVQDSNQGNLQKVISGFGPYQSYNASITASTIIGAGPPATTTGRTEPDSKFVANLYDCRLKLFYIIVVSSPVSILTEPIHIDGVYVTKSIPSINDTVVNLTWTPPQYPNGLITHYNITWSKYRISSTGSLTHLLSDLCKYTSSYY